MAPRKPDFQITRVLELENALAQSSTKRVFDTKLDLNVPKSGAFVLDFVLE
jgi:hypothetical protein